MEFGTIARLVRFASHTTPTRMLCRLSFVKEFVEILQFQTGMKIRIRNKSGKLFW